MSADGAAPVDAMKTGDDSYVTDRTGIAPLCPAPLAPVPDVDRPVPTLAIGQTIDDYEIVRLLGEGGFARVYLARQISLNRHVALKISANKGSEARTLARLEHQHIVQVFAEIVLAEKNLRLLAIQFIPGITLGRLIQVQALYDMDARSGRTFVEILDHHCTEATTFDLGGLEVRAFLQTCNHVELTCWLGARLAEALAHAHGQGVIHLDIKPANILINRYGRPFLADFNVALDATAKPGSIGGTLTYMSPEQLDTLLPKADRAPIAVDARSDIYSLALVLFEFLVGNRAFPRRMDESQWDESLRQMSCERHGTPPSAKKQRPDTPELMDRLLRRCLDPAPEHRFPTAAALMHGLDGCRALLQVEKEPGQQSWLVRVSRARPFRMVVILGIIPNLIGSVVNILYNEQLIVTKDPAQQASFYRLVLAYNSIAYPLLLVTGIFVFRRAWRGWQRLRTQTDVGAEEATCIRRHALGLSGCVVALSCLGWFPGAIVFPLGMHLEAGPLAAGDFAHFVISFVLSGLIATTYAYFAAQFVILRVLYPQLWSDPAGARETMQTELRGLPGQLRRYQLIAVLIPSLGAVLSIFSGSDTMTFKVLAAALIGLGSAGFFLATRICNRLTQVLARLTGMSHPSPSA